VNTPTLSRVLAALLALPLAAACTDQPLVPAPADDPAAGMARVECTVDVRAGTLRCAQAASTGGASLDRIVGGQETYLRLASSGAQYDGGTEEFRIDVTVQNLTMQTIGTPDGVTVEGMKVFFATGPTNGVLVANATGTDLFLGGPAPYFLYPQMLEPYEISDAATWVFDVSSGASSFSFTVYVSTPMTDESGPMLDAVWDGSEGSAWEVGGNWTDGVAPDSASTVAVPVDSLLGGAPHPVLAADAQVTNVRVGYLSTIDLAGYTLTAWGNVDAPGAIQNGTLRMGGTGALVGGTLPSLRVTGSARLQSAVRTTGAVSIQDGSLNVADRPLSIQIP
jgi:hypothetical protein